MRNSNPADQTEPQSQAAACTSSQRELSYPGCSGFNKLCQL